MEKNSTESLIIPETPRIRDVEKVMVYVPFASYSNKGTASFDSRDFYLLDGHVKLRNAIYDRYIASLSVDTATGIGTLYYTDGTVATITFPAFDEASILKTSILTDVHFEETSFVYSNEEYVLVLPNTVIGYTDNKYIAVVESLTQQEYTANYEKVLKDGYSSEVFSIFKSEDGTLVLRSIEPFKGRLLLVGGVFSEDISKHYSKVDSIQIEEDDDAGVNSIAKLTNAYLEFTDTSDDISNIEHSSSRTGKYLSFLATNNEYNHRTIVYPSTYDLDELTEDKQIVLTLPNVSGTLATLNDLNKKVDKAIVGGDSVYVETKDGVTRMTLIGTSSAAGGTIVKRTSANPDDPNDKGGQIHTAYATSASHATPFGQTVEIFTNLDDRKLDRVETADRYQRLYIISATGENKVANMVTTPDRIGYLNVPTYLSSTAYGDEVPPAGYCIIAPDPTKPYHLANKHYVDENFSKKLYKHNFMINVDDYNTGFLASVITTRATRFSLTKEDWKELGDLLYGQILYEQISYQYTVFCTGTIYSESLNKYWLIVELIAKGDGYYDGSPDINDLSIMSISYNGYNDIIEL